MPMMSEYRSRVAESFIRVLESGELNWRKPWNTGVTTAPYNPATNKRYNGINWIYLKATELNEGYRDNRWATFKQITDNGWHLKKGSRGTKVEYWMPLLPGKPGERGTVISWEKYRALSENQKAQAKFVPKYHTVFNGRDIEGLSEISIRANDNAVDADVLVWKISEAMQVSIFNDGGDTSFYSMSEDAIHLPEPKFFDDSYAYNATALHELAHATGAEERLNRDMVGSFGDKSYAYEELVAEITSCFMGEHIALPEAVKEEHLENHEAYVQG